MGENHLESREPQYFAEYSLWNDSAYSIFSIHPANRIEFTRPVDSSIFLTPPSLNLVEKPSDQVQPRSKSSPGFERYLKRALKVVTRDDLFRDPALFKKDPDSDDSEATSSNKPSNDRDIFLRPPRPRWRTPQQVNGRGRRMNLMQQRLEQALSQPARIERGASMMQRMGWNGGALGRGGGGIVEPIAPDPYYINRTAGLGLSLEPDSGGESPDSGSDSAQTKRSKSTPHQISKRVKKQIFKLNVLQYIREFVKNDLQVELFFEPSLNNSERKKIHNIVAKLMGEESPIVFDKMEMVYLARDIANRNAYALGTQSDGRAPHRQICVYKEATENMFLITPDDVRYPADIDPEEESNPFLQSIARHLKHDSPPEEHSMLDRIIDFFVEFSAQDTYTEFRFLGAYNVSEIDVMSAFFGTITSLLRLARFAAAADTALTPEMEYPERLVDAFERSLEKGIEYTADEDANGFVTIKKWFKLKDALKNAEETEQKSEK